jgi:hypothetical protein
LDGFVKRILSREEVIAIARVGPHDKGSNAERKMENKMKEHWSMHFYRQSGPPISVSIPKEDQVDHSQNNPL